MFSERWLGWAKVVFIFIAGLRFSQTAQSQALEEYFREDALGINSENYLEWRGASVLSLKNATDWQWLNWAKISPEQLSNLRSWQKTFGPIEKVWQLNAVEGFDSLTIDRIATLTESGALVSALPAGSLFPLNFGLVRHSLPSQGNRPWSQVRVQLNKKDWRLGLNLGLVWFKTEVYKQYTSPQIGLFTGFIERRLNDKLKVIIGNQSIRSGLGLVNGGAWRPNSAVRLEQSFSQPSGLMGMASNFSQWTPQGIGFEYASKSLQAFVFGGLQTFALSGINNTTSSRSIRSVNWRQPETDKATDTNTTGKTLAAYISKNLGKGFWIGTSVNFRETEIAVLPEGYGHSFSAYRSKRYGQASIDLKKVFGRMLFQTEWAIADNENKAFQFHIKWAATNRMVVSSTYRRASRWYMAPLSQAYTQNIRPGNEEGLWTAISYRKRNLEWIWTSEIYRGSPTFKFSSGNPWQHEHQGQLKRIFLSGWELIGRLRIRADNLTLDGSGQGFPTQGVLGLASPANRRFSGQFHLQLSEKAGSFTFLAKGIWQDFILNGTGWQLLSRTGYWQAENNLLYRFEPGMLYMPQTAVFSGSGFQQLTRLRFNLLTRYLMELRADWRYGRSMEWSFQLTVRDL